MPGVRPHLQPYELRAWLIGASRLATRVTPDTEEGMQRWQRAVRPVRLYERLTEADRNMHRLDREARAANKIGEPARIQQAKAAYVDGLKAWAEVVEAMREEGMRPPAMVPRWLDDARELGLLGHSDAGGDDGER